MPIILPNKKILHKPLNPRIDFRNTFAHQLVFDANLAENHGISTLDSINRTRGTIITGGARWIGTPYGAGLDFSAAPSSVNYTSPSNVNGIINPMSVEVLALIRSAGAGSLGRLVQKTSGTTDTSTAWSIRMGSATTLAFIVGFTTGAKGGTINFTPDAMFHDWLFVCSNMGSTSAGTIQIYMDGILQTLSVDNSGTGSIPTDDNNLYIGNRSDGTRNIDGQIGHVRIWQRALNSAEAYSLATNPFQIYQETLMRRPRIYIDAPVPATVTSETEQETAQIIIDKIFQGQIGGGATLNMNVNIPSPDAVLVVSGGSVIATGGAWQSVTYNGISLTKLVQAAVVGADAEIWYMPFPPVGTYTLSIVPTATFGQVYANAIVMLGVDKKSTNIMSASATDAASTSTISVNLTPDAPNSIVIDALSTLDPIGVPVPDASQTQMFNAVAINTNEYVLSTFKLSSNIQNNMNYNLSTSVNAALVAVAFRPANHPSLWFPNIDTREIDDTVTVSGLDSGTTPAFGNYGYKPSTFYLNSFFHTVGRSIQVITPYPKTATYGYKPSNFYLNSYLHTIGRNIKPSNPTVVTTVAGNTLLLMGVG